MLSTNLPYLKWLRNAGLDYILLSPSVVSKSLPDTEDHLTLTNKNFSARPIKGIDPWTHPVLWDF